MRTTMKHARHEHTLILRKFSQGIDYFCSLCEPCRDEPLSDEPLSDEIDNQAYCCEDCDFFIHKWCAESPQQIQHPSHPQHPLSLYIKDQLFQYRCGELECKEYRLHGVHAIATLPPEHHEEKTRDTDQQQLEFFGHCHPLNLFHVKIPTKIECRVCNHKIRGCSVYGCRACLFLIHESCAQLPRQIENHPLHPQHLLNLIVGEGQRYLSYIDCEFCDESVSYSGKGIYICDECNSKFCLHVNCAIASSIPSSDLVKLDHPSHARHQLISGYLKGGHNRVECQICRHLIKSGEVYGCTRKYIDERYSSGSCSFFVHKTCAELPWKLRHPFCPNGALTLIQIHEYERGGSCHACGSTIDYYNEAYYNYDDFNMHVRCAIETLSAILKGGATAKIQHFADDNLFFTCCYIPEPEGGKKDICLACRKYIEGLGYFCDEIYEYIHKSCAEELKPVLDQPFHQHPLLLVSLNKKEDVFFCKGCNGNSTDDEYCYYYSCGACGFQLDLKCALRKPTFKDPCHQHDLAYFEHVKYMRCNACGYNCNNDLYRCVECNFSVHLDCLPLPTVVQDNECHIHPLTLCDNVPDQDCDVCSLETNPRHRAYHCEECNFVADVECVLFKGVKPKDSPRLMEEIDEAATELECLQKSLQKQIATLNALKSMKKRGWERRSKKSVLLEEDSLSSDDHNAQGKDEVKSIMLGLERNLEALESMKIKES